jgi:hypothetical protein
MERIASSSIGRPIDLHYASNRFALAAATVSGLAWAGWKWFRYADAGEAMLRGAVGFAAAFLAWALARELDPDRPWVAGVAAVAASAVLGAGVPSLLVAATALLAARVTARTTGRPPGIGDMFVLAGLAGWAGSTDAGVPAGLIVAAVLAADRWLPGGAHRWSPAAGVLAAGAATAAGILWGAAPAPGLPSGAEWVVVVMAVPAVAGLGRPREVVSTGDQTGDPLDPRRVRAGRLAVFTAALGAFAWAGGPGLTSGSVVWAALTAAALPSPPGADEPRRGGARLGSEDA